MDTLPPPSLSLSIHLVLQFVVMSGSLSVVSVVPFDVSIQSEDSTDTTRPYRSGKLSDVCREGRQSSFRQ